MEKIWDVHVSNVKVGKLPDLVYRQIKRRVLLDPSMWLRSIIHTLSLTQVVKVAFFLPPATFFWVVAYLVFSTPRNTLISKVSEALTNANAALNLWAQMYVPSIVMPLFLAMVLLLVFPLFSGRERHREIFDVEVGKRIRRIMNVPSDGTVTLESTN